jgi:hypothetical protein
MSSFDKDAEEFKHTLAIKLEAEKWKTRKEELRYLEAGQHLRSLNQYLWQVPGMVVAITGGIWYGVTTMAADPPKIIALIFVAIVNLLTIPVIWRLRSLIAIQIQIQNTFAGLSSIDQWRHSVISCWTALLLIAASLSLFGACNSTNLSRQSTPDSAIAGNSSSRGDLPPSPALKAAPEEWRFQRPSSSQSSSKPQK